MNVGSDNHVETICSDKCFELFGTRSQEAGGEAAIGKTGNFGYCHPHHAQVVPWPCTAALNHLNVVSLVS